MSGAALPSDKNSADSHVGWFISLAGCGKRQSKNDCCQRRSEGDVMERSWEWTSPSLKMGLCSLWYRQSRLNLTEPPFAIH